jgi:hypothetical protein
MDCWINGDGKLGLGAALSLRQYAVAYFQYSNIPLFQHSANELKGIYKFNTFYFNGL